MISIFTMIIIIWIHFIADFLLQTRKMATYKSSHIKWLTIHVCMYSLPWLIFGVAFAIINGLLHFVTDFFTSKMTSALYQRENMFAFWAVIGLDQAIHITTLLMTYNWLVV